MIQQKMDKKGYSLVMSGERLHGELLVSDKLCTEKSVMFSKCYFKVKYYNK